MTAKQTQLINGLLMSSNSDDSFCFKYVPKDGIARQSVKGKNHYTLHRALRLYRAQPSRFRPLRNGWVRQFEFHLRQSSQKANKFELLRHFGGHKSRELGKSLVFLRRREYIITPHLEPDRWVQHHSSEWERWCDWRGTNRWHWEREPWSK